MRDAVEGKVNGARINIPAWMEVDGERRRSRGGRKEGRKEGREEGGRKKRRARWMRCGARSSDFIRGRARSPTINSVLWPGKSYDGNRVNHREGAWSGGFTRCVWL